MKTIMLILSLLFIISCRPARQVEVINNYQDFKKNFKTIPNEYKTVPFWVWHYRVTREEIDRQLTDFKEKGFGGVFIHPRYGLVTEYLSQEWFDLVSYCVKKAKELDMDIWLYDENSFPSGFGGGHVPANMPESYNQGQGLTMHVTNQLSVEDRKKIFLLLKMEADAFVKLEPGGDMPVLQDSNYYWFEKTYYDKSKWYGGFSYVDLLVPGVTEKFIELTMQGYEQSIGLEFGNRVKGIFTDEPHIDVPTRRSSIRYTPDLFIEFQKRWQYDLETMLPALVEEIGDWRRVRHNYYQLLLELFIKRWSKPWFEYCERNELQWTGHYWEHGWPGINHGPDNMAMYAWHHVPAIDMLFNRFDLGPNAQFGNIRAVKELSSVANQMGRKRTLSETYGAAGWELTFEDMKRLGDWQYALGVNFMNQHLSYMTLAGDRKHDFPQSFSYHDSWWHLYKPLADYYARLSLALSSGRQKNDILILEPTTSIWLYFNRKNDNEQGKGIGDLFQKFLVQLERNHVEYDLGSEDIIKNHAAVMDDNLQIGFCKYNQLILPPGTENINSATLDIFKHYLSKGGRILSVGELPRFTDGAESDACSRLTEQYPQQWRKIVKWDDRFLHKNLIRSSFTIETSGGNDSLLFHQRRFLQDGQLLFMVNSSSEDSCAGTVILTAAGVELCDPFTGEMEVIQSQRVNDQLRFSFTLPPAGSSLFYLQNSKVLRSGNKSPVTYTTMEFAAGVEIRRKDPNVLVLDYCDLQLGDRYHEGLYFYTASDMIFKHHGFADNPWVSSAQYKTNILDRDTFNVSSGFNATFPFEINGKVEIDYMQAVVERRELWQVFVNDQPVEAVSGKWWLDREFAVYDIAQYVKSGKNHLRLRCNPMSIHAELEPVYILGDFNLKSVNKGWMIIPEKNVSFGEWRKQGLPYYANGINYKHQVNIAKLMGTYFIKLNKWHGTVAEIRVNGEYSGIIGWQPYRLNITDKLREGPNEIDIIVYGSLKNLLGPHHNVRQRGIVTPWSFKYAPNVQPAGKDYDNDGYGLYEPVSLIRMN